MRIVALSLGAAIAFFTASAQADIACAFETECLEGEACMDSGYELTVRTELDPQAVLSLSASVIDFPAKTEIETIAGNITDLAWSATDGALAVSGRDTSGFHLLSMNTEGRARYSVHLPRADLAIHYIGTCRKED